MTKNAIFNYFLEFKSCQQSNYFFLSSRLKNNIDTIISRSDTSKITEKGHKNA